MTTMLERTAPSITLDDILLDQRRQQILATVEEVEDDEDRVKLTPWAAGGGCQCGLAILVAKDAIASVEPTGEKHFCCGKSFHVVDVEFNEGATIELRDLFTQLMARLKGGQHDHQANGTAPAGPPVLNVGALPPPMYQAPQLMAPMPAPVPCGPPAWSPMSADPRIFLQPNGRF